MFQGLAVFRHLMIFSSVLRLSSVVVPQMLSLYARTRVSSLSEGKVGNVMIFGLTLLRLCVILVQSAFLFFIGF
jgi:hypothetical protein